MKPKEFKDILQKYIDGICTREERIIVEKWCDYIVEKERKTIEHPFESKAGIYAGIVRANVSGHYRHSAKIRFFAVTDAVAAAVLIAALFFTQFNGIFSTGRLDLVNGANPVTSNSVVINNSASPMKVHFEDGTEVILDPKSKLSHVIFTGEDRKLTLEGKAFFNVARNPKRPFYIYTKNITTRVLGTSFIIDAQVGGEETVEVKTGKVAVYRKEAKAKVVLPDSFVTVTPNHQVHFYREKKKLVSSIIEHPTPVINLNQEISEINTNAAKQSTALRMEFEETPFTDVLKTLEAAYGVKIKFNLSRSADCTVTISLIDEDLFTRLKAVCDATGSSYQVEGTEILVSSAGCGQPK